MRNNLKQVMEVVKNEVKEVEEFLERIICWSNGDNHQVPTVRPVEKCKNSKLIHFIPEVSMN